MLKEMFEHQKELQKKLGTLSKMNESEPMRQKYVNQQILAIHEEAVEIMRESAYKNPDFVEFGWKKGQQWDVDKFKEEIIDLWHFVMNLCIACNMDADEFYVRYCQKNKINIERKAKGY